MRKNTGLKGCGSGLRDNTLVTLGRSDSEWVSDPDSEIG